MQSWKEEFGLKPPHSHSAHRRHFRVHFFLSFFLSFILRSARGKNSVGRSVVVTRKQFGRFCSQHTHRRTDRQTNTQTDSDVERDAIRSDANERNPSRPERERRRWAAMTMAEARKSRSKSQVLQSEAERSDSIWSEGRALMRSIKKNRSLTHYDVVNIADVQVVQYSMNEWQTFCKPQRRRQKCVIAGLNLATIQLSRH